MVQSFQLEIQDKSPAPPQTFCLSRTWEAPQDSGTQLSVQTSIFKTGDGRSFKYQNISEGGSKAAELLLGQYRRALTPVTRFSLAPSALRSGLGVQPWVWCPTLPLQHQGQTGAGSGLAELFKRCQGVQPSPGCRKTTLCHKKIIKFLQ